MHIICINYISKGLNLKNIFEIFTTLSLLKKTDICIFKKSVFRPYLSQFLTDFENLWYHYERRNEILKLNT